MMSYIARSVNLVNAALAAVLAALVVFVVLPLFHPKAGYVLPRGKSQALDEAIPQAPAAPPALDYASVGENNLFHPDRKVPESKAAKPVLPRPELVLYGTVIDGRSSLAFIEDRKSPKTTPGRGKRQSVVKKGDRLGDFVLREILADKILLSRDEETMTVYLTDGSKKREGAQPAKGAPAPQAAAPSPQTAAAKPAPPAANRTASWTMKTGPQHIPGSPAPSLVAKPTGRGRIYRY